MDRTSGAEELAASTGLTRVVREQIGKGADWVKVYADYRWVQVELPTRRLRGRVEACC